MKITIDEEKFNDLCSKARDIYLNNLKKAAEEKGEKMPKLIEASETVSMIIFGAELRKIMFENTKADDETPDKNDDSITIKLNFPKEFIFSHKKDNVIESLKKIRFDIWRSHTKQIYNPCVSGVYEINLLDIIINALHNFE